MGTRLDLHQELLTLAPKAYYQPPSSIQMTYPCIVYHLSNIKTIHANNHVYKTFKSYMITYITKMPDDSKVDEISTHFPSCQFDRHYVADNLHHYTFSLFY